MEPVSVLNRKHLQLMEQLSAAAERAGLPLWLGGGWGVDARLGRITRGHGDIDLVVPAERREEFLTMLEPWNPGPVEEMDYGYLVTVEGVLLDCEPAFCQDGNYELEGVPSGSCPWEAQGQLEGRPVRCTSWEAVLWDYFHYLAEVSYGDWPDKDRDSFRLVCGVVGEDNVSELQEQFRLLTGLLPSSPLGITTGK